MIINDLHVLRVSAMPTEADSPLIVYANAVLPGTVTDELFQPVSRWHAEVSKFGSRVDHCEFSPCDALDRPKTPDWIAVV